MKIQAFKKLDLRSFPKSVRTIIKSKKNEVDNQLNQDIKSLFAKERISREDFLTLFRNHRQNIFAKSEDYDKVKFKKDGTPDLRSIPKSVRELFKYYNNDAENQKSMKIEMFLNKETITEDDLESVRNIAKKNLFKEKWLI